MSSEVMFWSGSIVMVAIALFFLLPPLLGRGKTVGVARRETNLTIFQQRLEELKDDRESGEISSEQFEQAEADLKRELLADLEGEEHKVEQNSSAGRVGALIAIVLVPLIAFGIYGKIGAPEAINVKVASASAQQQQSTKNFEDVVAQLEKKLEQNPDNSEGWMMLAKSYEVLGRNSEIVNVYERAIEKMGESVDSQLFMEYGEALATRNGGSWMGKPVDQLTRALDIDPTNRDALWISGHAYFDLGKYEKALGFWERLANTAPTDDPEIVNMINEAAYEAQEQLGREKTALLKLVAVPAGTVLTVAVALDQSLQEMVSAEDVVFIYAKAQGKKGPPLAAQRLTVASLPTTIQLDDTMAMIASNNLSSADQIVVGAKVSKSGVATGGSGDLVGTVETTTSQTDTIKLVINQIVE
ncbi:MAG: c-type cytochrome biogenesis protein CcmI [Gammaproteobacteria bacterium]|uniref:C-type cytochrome biogenesis protein CcmI n=1 Tax=Candidatus Thiopontia autotrophica TaxID=2841688 RepID=A0A8J6TVW5_9GAMM|nr:c-type cytochrome biogenesis protein CcmI [Candidatus Thiopontia autotrophica]MBL6969343.1 c-type cytochrome biogenesis protein CcmI [Gammaproteobacteria bacterium]